MQFARILLLLVLACGSSSGQVSGLGEGPSQTAPRQHHYEQPPNGEAEPNSSLNFIPTALLNTLERREQEFLAEDRDHEWAAPTEVQLYAAISQLEEFAAISISVECRATLCRIEILASRPADLIALQEDRVHDVLAKATSTEVASLRVASDGDSYSFTLFLSRTLKVQ